MTVQSQSKQQPCALCVEFRRGERADQSFGGLHVHLCERMEGEVVTVGYDVCPCGCDLSQSKHVPKFGEWLTGIYASDDNPHKHGIYVRTIRWTGRVMNPGTFYELTDGNGDFWQYPVDRVRPAKQGEGHA